MSRGAMAASAANEPPTTAKMSQPVAGGRIRYRPVMDRTPARIKLPKGAATAIAATATRAQLE